MQNKRIQGQISKALGFKALETIDEIVPVYKIQILEEILGKYPQHKAKIKEFFYSDSQLAQDVFVLSALDFKTKGFFVEFGATDGKGLSNSYLLEQMGWDGILAEPAKCWHEALVKNRKAAIDYGCVWSTSNAKILFTEARLLPEVSTISSYTDCDGHIHNRKNGFEYYVNTISLNDLLLKYNAPKIIDYLSIDTEGSEFDILNNFCFEHYKIKIISCEHNYTKQRNKIETLLCSKGYKKVLQDKTEWDDWYIAGEFYDIKER
jgi:FkbM family methyltransferase